MAESFVEMNICLCQRVLGDYIPEIICREEKILYLRTDFNKTI